MKNKIMCLVAYTIAVFTTVSAFEVYAEFLKDYNYGFALAGFEGLGLIMLIYIYPKFERTVLRKLRITPEVNAMSVKEAFTRQPAVITYLSVSNVVKFMCMLPFLTSLENSLLYVIFLLLSNLFKVPLAVKIFNDPIRSHAIYSIGLLLVIFGGLAYTLNPMRSGAGLNLGVSLMLIAAVVKLILEIIDSLLQRYICTYNKSGERTVSVNAVELIKTLFTIPAGMLIGLFILVTNRNVIIFPTLTQIGAIAWIGIIVTLAGTISIVLLTKITHALSQPIQGIRPVLGFLPMIYTYYTVGGDSLDLIYKAFCLIPILCGVFICLKNGEYIKA